MRKYKSLVLIILILLLILIAMFGQYLAPYDALEVNYTQSLQAPSLSHLLGTDKLGRDILSRVLCGAQSSLMLTFVMVFIIVIIGILIGLISAYMPAFVDHLIMRSIDVLLAFPDTVFAIAMVGVMGVGIFNTIIALSLIGWTKYARLTRALVQSIQHSDYIQAARLVGVRKIKLIACYVLPEVFPQIIVSATNDLGTMMMTLAGLSFLGLASQPPLPEWGSMLFESKQYMQTAPWMMLGPGLAIFISVVLLNIFGDELRDRLDPKKSRRNS